MLLTAISPLGTIGFQIERRAVGGSSQDGMKRRASEFSNWVKRPRLRPAGVS
jgi:hypothetical protein